MSKSVNCLIVDDEPIAIEILENYLKKIPQFEIVDTCKNAMSAFEVINSKQIDLIFLDINMPGISGLSFAKSINKDIKIIFTTAYREYAVDGFDLQAVDYLLKPISFERLTQALNKYQKELSINHTASDSEIIQESSTYFFVRSDRKMIKIDFDDIYYIESFSDYLKIHQKDSTIITRETITSAEAKLPQKDFIRIHRSYIISIAHIAAFTNEYIEVGKEQLPISRTYKKEVLERLESK